MDIWEKAKIISTILASVGIPLVIVIIGNVYSKALKERELQGKFVELAVQILNSDPKPEAKNIRGWATRVINLYSGVQLDEPTQKDLIENVPLVEKRIPDIYNDIEIPEQESGNLRVENNFLVGGNTDYMLSPNTSGETKLTDIKALVIHYTAGPSLESSAKTLTNSSMNASTHLLIGRDGSIIQIVPFNYLSWHAGRSEFRGVKGFNRYSIGISLDNAGSLTKKGSKYFTWFGQEIDPAEVESATHKHDNSPTYWQKFTEKQIEATHKVCGLLAKEYSVQWILGHEDLNNRKRDPGPLFPMKKLQTTVLGHEIE